MNAPADRAEDRGAASLLASMVATRLELAALDLEAHVEASLVSLLTGFIALISSLIAFTFVGVAVIAIFWETHRIAAAVLTTLSYCALSILLAGSAQRRWKKRPPAFAGALHELELDGHAFRDVK